MGSINCRRMLWVLVLVVGLFAILIAPAAADTQSLYISPGTGDYYTTHYHSSSQLQQCGAEWTNQDDDTIDEYSTSSVRFEIFGITAYDETGPVYGGPYWVIDETDGNNDYESFAINGSRLDNNQYYDFSTGHTVGSASGYEPYSIIQLWSGAFGTGGLYCSPEDEVVYDPTSSLTSSSASTARTQRFASIQQAQAAVPFRVRRLSVPMGYHLALADVRTEHSLKTGVITTLTLTYTSSSHDAITVEERTADSGVSIPGESTQLTTVAGVPATAITWKNISGVSIGIVHWKAHGIYFTLSATNSDGLAATSLAASVN